MGLMRNKNLELEYSKILDDLGLDLDSDILKKENTSDNIDNTKKENND